MKKVFLLYVPMTLLLAVAGGGTYAVTSKSPDNQAFFRTRWLLFRNMWVDNTNEIIKHLSTYHGEGPDKTKYIQVACWSLREPKAFVHLLQAMDNSKRKEFTRLIAFTLYDTGMSSRFMGIYGNSAVKEIVEIRSAINESKQ